jgi:hypothetical protein
MWHWVELHKLYVYMRETSPDSLKEILPDKMIADEAEYERVKGLFQYKVTNPDGTERAVKQDAWCRDNLFRRAEKVNLAQSYRTIMPPANQILYGSIGGWIRELDQESGRVEFPPTHRWGGEALIAAHMALLQAVETVAQSFGVTPNPSIKTLKDDFDAIWTDGPVTKDEASA